MDRSMQRATSTTSSRQAVLSLVTASLITFVLVYSLSQASWLESGGDPGVRTRTRTRTGVYDDVCLSSLSDGHWELSTEGCPPITPGMLHHCDNSTGFPRHWASGAPANCLPSNLMRADVASMFQDKRIAFVGDSHLRKLYNFLGEFLANEGITEAPASDKKEHKDFSTTIKATGTRLEFYWRAEIRSTTSVLNDFLGLGGRDDEGAGEVPDLVVCDASAHQAKWARDFDAFVDELPGLIESVAKYHEMFPRSLIVWMISPPFKEVYNPAVPETKFFYSLRKFNSALRGAGIFMPNGPVVPIDMYRIAEGCMDYCYRDNTHVLPSVNVLLFQMITGAYRRYVTEITY